MLLRDKINHSATNIMLRLICLFMCCGVVCNISPAAQPSDGYFYGVNLEPVGDAEINTVETEPAVALIFAADQKTAEITKQFDAWYADPARPDVTVFAIAVEPTEISRDVVLEAINQRNLQMPVYLSSSDMLLGDDYRLLVLNNDQEAARFTTLDVAGVYDALSKLGVSIPPQAATATPTPLSEPTPDVTVPTTSTRTVIAPTVPGDDTTVTVEIKSGMLPDGSTYSTITTTTRSRSSSSVRGGESGEQVYENDTYGMKVEFPPGWSYQVASKDDGAVAVAPAGSKMDMRIWALPADDIDSAEDYVDENLEALAEKYKTRVNVERRFYVSHEGPDGFDVTYSYARPIDESAPARGGLVYRGRMQVFVEDDLVKAASVNAPSAEFMARYPQVESFIHSFDVESGHNPPSVEYDPPDVI